MVGGKWAQNKELKQGGLLDIQGPQAGERPDPGFAPGGWDETPPAQLKWMFSGDAGKHLTFTYTYEKSYTVTYYDGEDRLASEQVKAGGVAAGHTPEKEHYTFKGWATEPGGPAAYAPGQAIEAHEDLDLFAVWEVKMYNQTFLAYVDGLYEDEVRSSAFRLSRTIRFDDGTEDGYTVTFDKDNADNIHYLGSGTLAPEKRTTITIRWNIQLPETVIGTKPVVLNEEDQRGYSDGNPYVWYVEKKMLNANDAMPVPNHTEIAITTVDVRVRTSYYRAPGGDISSTAGKWDGTYHNGQYDYGSYFIEDSKPYVGPAGATATAHPGYVFKGWYACDKNGRITSQEPVTTAEALTAADMPRMESGIWRSALWYVPVFESVTMAVQGGSWEYDYDIHYPEVTFAPAEGGAGLTVQYRTENGQWSDRPVGIKHVAEGPMTVEVRAVDGSGAEICAPQPVTLEVTPHPVTIRSRTETYYYTTYETGTASSLEAPGVEAFYEARDSHGFGGFIGSTCDGQIDAGYYPEHFTFDPQWDTPNLASQDRIYRSDYDADIQYGDLTILPRQITVTETLTLPYTGESQSLHIDKLGSDTGKGDFSKNKPAKGLYARERLLATLTAAGPGAYTVTRNADGTWSASQGAAFEYRVLKEDGRTDSTRNYDITFQLTLIIQESGHDVAMEGWTYGETAKDPEITPPSIDGYGQGIVTYYDQTGIALEAKPENAGTYTVKAVWEGQGLPTLTAVASFTIAKAGVTIKPQDAGKVYDGQPLTATGYEIVAGGFYGRDAENYEFTYTGSQTDKGESASAVSTVCRPGAPDNYEIAAEPGKLTVTAKAVSPKEPNGVEVGALENVKYNGRSQELKPLVKDGQRTLEEGVDYTLRYSEDTTNVGRVTVTVTFQGNYSGSATGKYSIERRQLNYFYQTDTVYNGREQRAPLDYTQMTFDSGLPGSNYFELVEGHSFTYVNGDTYYAAGTKATQVNRSVSAPDISKGVKNFTIVDAEGNDVSGNYALGAQVRLSIAKAPLTVRAVDDEKVYGTADPALAYEIVDGTLYDRDAENGYITFAVDREAGEDARTYGMTVSYQYPNGAKTKEKNYDVTLLPGEFTITPAPLTVTTGSAAKAYDGQPLTAPESAVTGLANGETAAARTNGSITQVGSVRNTYQMEWDTAKESNYRIVLEELGTLTIDPAIAVTVENGTFTAGSLYGEYAGETALSVGVAAGEDLTIVFTPDEDYALDSVTVDGEPAALTDGAYTFADVTGNHTIQVVFAVDANGNGVPDADEPDEPDEPDGPGDPGGNPGGGPGGGPGGAPGGNPGGGPGGAPGDDPGGAPAGGADAGQPGGDGDNAAPVNIGEDETPLTDAPLAGGGDETVAQLEEDETPLANGPITEECCVLHLLLMLCALAAAVYYAHERKKHQQEDFDARARML